ncbi:unnamed protein product [Mytilus edulis]|uniref:Talin IBS2B domain-containing protein n=1 Tax=Mytilus edulis TaxID=6550 RepID=A0A8S3RZ77_MYTED|nr:unnamed protein product [Mytilus edulis]
MNASSSRTLAAICESCTTKIQSVAELLLLSCCVRPVLTETIRFLPSEKLHDSITSTLRSIKDLSQTLVSNVHMISAKWVEICDSVEELSSVLIKFMEIICHACYLITVNFAKCTLAETGLIDKYSVCYSGLEIKLSCFRLKRTRIDELSPQIIIDLCSNISKHIAVITDICRTAGQNVKDEGLQDQFKLSVKSVTCAAGCLIASIKSYKSNPNITQHSRVMVFCEPVIASSQALVSFATEKDFNGCEGTLTVQSKDVQKRILGSCMSVVSASIQLCKTVRDLTYDMITSHHRERLKSCTEAISHGAVKLMKILDDYDINKLLSDYRAKQDDLSPDLSNDRFCSKQSLPFLPDMSLSSLPMLSSPTLVSRSFDSTSTTSSVETNSFSLYSEDEHSHSVNERNHGDQSNTQDHHSDNSTSFSSSENSLASR